MKRQLKIVLLAAAVLERGRFSAFLDLSFLSAGINKCQCITSSKPQMSQETGQALPVLSAGSLTFATEREVECRCTH